MCIYGGIKFDTGTHIRPSLGLGGYKAREAVHKYCQYCNAKGEVVINSTNSALTAEPTYSVASASLDTASSSVGTNVQIALVPHTELPFCWWDLLSCTGLAIVLLLLSLNLTVSMGTINGLVFYSNIVYLNRDVLLPLNQGTGQTHMDNVITLLFTFQAWMNLDFGITMHVLL